MKALYRHRKSGDIFAIETDASGSVLSTAGPLLSKDIDPEKIDYDNYFSSEIKHKLKGFELLSRYEYDQLLQSRGFTRQSSQKRLF